MTTKEKIPTGRRERKRKAKIAQILNVAMDLVVKGGLESLTIHAIARELDWAVGATYRYFDSKDAIFVALQAQAISEYRQHCLSALEEFQQSQQKDHLDHWCQTCSLTVSYSLKPLL